MPNGFPKHKPASMPQLKGVFNSCKLLEENAMAVLANANTGMMIK